MPPPPSRRFSDSSMATSLSIFYRTSKTLHTIVTASEGFEQGDAADPALFACGLKKPLNELLVKLQNFLFEERERRAMARNDSCLNYLNGCAFSRFARLFSLFRSSFRAFSLCARLFSVHFS